MKAFVSAVFLAVNRVLEIIGLRLLRTNAPVRNFALFFKHLKSLGFEVRTVIDVGIAFGTSPIYDAFPRARYFLVEPVAECRPVLETLKARLNAEYFLVAAGAENGEVTFNVHDDISGSSLFAQVEGKVLDGQARPTPMRRLDSLLPANLEHPVFLKVDTQGAELEVLKGLGIRIGDIELLILGDHGSDADAMACNSPTSCGFATKAGCGLRHTGRPYAGAGWRISKSVWPSSAKGQRVAQRAGVFQSDQLADSISRLQAKITQREDG